MEFVFEAYGDKLIARKLDRLAGRSVQAEPAFRSIADTLRGYERRLFDSQGASGGRLWPPLQPSTLARKAALGQDPRVLHATGRLRASLTKKHDPEHLELTGPGSLIFGSLVPYAGYHQRGSGSLPRRRPLQYTEKQKRYIINKLQRYVMTGEV